VPHRLHRAVIEAAEVCPGECIFLEIDAPEALPAGEAAA
jgi:hypothetical protein